jgi:hypothetical protein
MFHFCPPQVVSPFNCFARLPEPIVWAILNFHIPDVPCMSVGEFTKCNCHACHPFRESCATAPVLLPRQASLSSESVFSRILASDLPLFAISDEALWQAYSVGQLQVLRWRAVCKWFGHVIADATRGKIIVLTTGKPPSHFQGAVKICGQEGGHVGTVIPNWRDWRRSYEALPLSRLLEPRWALGFPYLRVLQLSSADEAWDVWDAFHLLRPIAPQLLHLRLTGFRATDQERDESQVWAFTSLQTLVIEGNCGHRFNYLQPLARGSHATLTALCFTYFKATVQHAGDAIVTTAVSAFPNVRLKNYSLTLFHTDALQLSSKLHHQFHMHSTFHHLCAPRPRGSVGV